MKKSKAKLHYFLNYILQQKEISFIIYHFKDNLKYQLFSPQNGFRVFQLLFLARTWIPTSCLWRTVQSNSLQFTIDRARYLERTPRNLSWTCLAHKRVWESWPIISPIDWYIHIYIYIVYIFVLFHLLEHL